ncbi:MAG: D-alanine--D-alanine ligase [Chloroflexi bacterium]|nr:MAG: D-alanine--D-alanine ligase [Chloroflexi bacterium OLB13]MBW7879204.1 D-alanine--D-alanine ligase [Anaerolineae bacterium]MCC6565690.1 D-alanine--D-alanine ligase [Chloroflexota bacterium]MDL1915506.1 D-alanine--D-alanine ligase [Anaerolineae bacterium CFX4]
MSARRKTTVAVIFGGRSVEHDVSIITGSQIMRAFDPARYDVAAVYITRDGRWFTGEPLKSLDSFTGDVTSVKGVEPVVLSPSTQHHGLIVKPVTGLFQRAAVQRVDVLFPAVHGSHGEDGTLQGLFELADIPYVGCGVLASALANDKALTKVVLRQAGVPVVDDVVFTRAEWQDDAEAVLARIEERLSFPLFVKPVTLGSSIGVGRVNDRALLRATIEVATSFDRRVIVEPAVVDCVEINCAVMGDDTGLTASVLEQPKGWAEFLTYEDKYMRGGEGMKSAERLIPAPLSPEQTGRIQSLAKQAFAAIEGRGIARIDFLVRGDEVFLNEINTMPGSLALYLWSETGMSSGDVVDRLVTLAQNAGAEKRRTSFDYQSNLVQITKQRGGLKGLKGSKSPAAAKPTPTNA